jgi:hypothetical protein
VRGGRPQSLTASGCQGSRVVVAKEAGVERGQDARIGLPAKARRLADRVEGFVVLLSEVTLVELCARSHMVSNLQTEAL